MMDASKLIMTTAKMPGYQAHWTASAALASMDVVARCSSAAARVGLVVRDAVPPYRSRWICWW